MKTTAKYLFDEDFAAREKPTITVVEAERRRADAESQAYRNGFAAGQAQTQREALAVIAGGLERLDKALAGIETRLEIEAVEVAVAVAAKLAPALIAREPFAEISALATETFTHLVKAPHVNVHIGAEAYEDNKGKIEEIARGRGFEGRLVLLQDPSMALGDCRIKWADGGVTRDRAATLAVIDDAVARYAAARTGATN